MPRRTHSSIDTLPAEIRKVITAMLVDNEWPSDFTNHYKGKPRYEDLVAYCGQKGHIVSSSAIGRFGKQMKTWSLMKNAGLIARETMAGMTAEDAPKTQKAAAEMATALALEFMVSHDDYSAKQIKDISQAMRDCVQISIKADQYSRDRTKEKAAKADKAISKLAKAKKMDPDTLKQIREEVYGIFK